MQRLRSSAPSFLRTFRVLQLKRGASNTWSAVQDTYTSTKNVFERHRVVFTIGTSIASIATAWAGYSLRYLHQSKVEQRLDSIEQAGKQLYETGIQLERVDLPMDDESSSCGAGGNQKIVNAGNVSYETLAAAAATSLIVGYGFGWRGGKWHANRIFRKQQQKLLGLNKPQTQRWRFLRKPFLRLRKSESKVEYRVPSPDASSSQQAQLS